MTDPLVARATNILGDVQFPGYYFTVIEGHGGVYVQATYLDTDIYTKEVSTQHTRKWLLSPSMTPSEIVQTVFKLCMTSFEHRCREAFKYQDARIFGPHFDVADLVKLCRDGREDAGGRLPPETH